ncbi:MAG TPA: GNAT family N-acetyltransferase [Acidimicrobiales bacterium]|jgi:RimJ/RimL family protein N-acetyltransferase|nr:GNAT family N-acetyltransferase [Acidimicrobiales bacterium]
MSAADGFRVRPAAAADVDQLVRLFVAVVDEGRWLGTEPPVDTAAQHDRFLHQIEEPVDSASMVAASLDGDRVIGHAGVHLEPFKVAGLGMMVDAGWRGRGVGGALVEAAIAAARDLGAHKLALQAWPHNDVAIRLYRRHGFVDEGLLRRHYRRRNGELWDAVIMGLVLDEASPGSSLPA